MDLTDFRENYSKYKLDDDALPAHPEILFETWFTETLKAGIEDPTAMMLATSDKEGNPSARMVLLKGLDPRGFIFYTNYLSRKGRELSENSRAALLFFWKEFHRQVRIEGDTQRLTEKESDRYFAQRPEESKISSIISPQSSIVPDRTWLEERVKTFKIDHPNEALQRPESWGGYLLIPKVYEFWQGRENRLHDRIQYTSKGDIWIINRLAP